ncbi:MAG: hypothetical protein M1817_006887 [Caeruleum heppii]|nr:MAG: hypothetical protein M1817_006887 [Caeruleum heppii]
MSPTVRAKIDSWNSFQAACDWPSRRAAQKHSRARPKVNGPYGGVYGKDQGDENLQPDRKDRCRPLDRIRALARRKEERALEKAKDAIFGVNRPSATRVPTPRKRGRGLKDFESVEHLTLDEDVKSRARSARCDQWCPVLDGDVNEEPWTETTYRSEGVFTKIIRKRHPGRDGDEGPGSLG